MAKTLGFSSQLHAKFSLILAGNLMPRFAFQIFSAYKLLNQDMMPRMMAKAL